MTMVVLGGVLATAGALLGGLGWKKYDSEKQVLSLAVAPSIEISVVPKGDNEQEFIIANTGPHELVNVTLAPVGYLVQKQPVQILKRSIGTGGFPVAEKLAPGAQVRVATKLASVALPSIQDAQKEMNALAAVVVYRRKVDNKRYVEVEPYLAAAMPPDNRMFLFPLFAGKDPPSSVSATQAPPGHFLGMMKEIIDGERFYFNAR